MPGKLPSSSHFGGNHKTDHFYPKIRTYPIYSEADIVTKDNEFLHISVTYEVGLKKTRKFSQIVKKLGAIVGLPPKWVCRGAFLPITKTINSSIFRPISVTHEQDSMPVKYNAFLMNKLHPTETLHVTKHLILFTESPQQSVHWCQCQMLKQN